MILKHLSPSRIKTFEQCQMKYHAIYEEKLDEGPPHPLTVMGKAVHKAAELGVAQMMGNQAVYFPALVRKACASMGVSKPNSELAQKLMDNAIKWGYLRNIEHCAGVEIEFNEELPDGTKVKGIIDRLDILPQLADVIDLKTQQSPFDDASLRKEWQSIAYNWAVRKLRPEITGDVQMSYWTLRHRVQRCWLTADDAKRGQDILMTKANEIRRCEAPETSPSPLCRWCPKADCPGRNEGLKKQFKRRFK